MPSYDESVFINCPFDDAYRPLFDALIFVVHDCGFFARCAMETDDSGDTRIQKLFEIIRSCRLGIHDISRTELDAVNGLPRFNMPLELGMFLGARAYGDADQQRKICKVLDRDKYRYQKYCSDIAGQDISSHDDEPEPAIARIRDWLRAAQPDSTIQIPSGSVIFRRYEQFRANLPVLCRPLGLSGEEDLIFVDFRNLVVEWLKQNPLAEWLKLNPL